MSTVSVSIPENLAERLAREASRRHMSPDMIVQRALEMTLKDQEETVAGNFFDAARNYMGMFEGPRDISTNPEYLDDFGG